jgi:dipeptidyl aminopeptidase/acylaminoacyl peptidase
VVAYRPPEFEPGESEPGKFLLWIHGGPMAYDQPRFELMDGYFTSRGYTIWKVNYRGSTSYGREFCERLKGAWNGAEVADLLSAVDAAVDRGWAAPDRLFVGGFSQGGVNTGYLVTRREFTAAAAEHGIYDLRSSFGTDDSHNWLEADNGLPWEAPETYDAASSIPDVDRVETPTLLTAGENDHRCPPSQAEQFYVSLRKRGVDSKLVIYQDEHHDVGDPDRAIHRLETLEGWFADHDPHEDAAPASEEG